MIDESKIKEAANSFLKKTREAYTWDCGIVSYSTEIKEIENEIEEDFIAGAQWAQQEFVKTLWHDASEEPKCNIFTPCVVELEGDYYNGRKFEIHDYHKGCGFSNSEGWVDKKEVIKWCYLSDILPKKGGEK